MINDEIELKFAVPEPRLRRRRITALGFRITRQRRLERNWIFDDVAGSLRRNGRLLRLRQSGADWILTVKGPRKPGPLKRRREVETSVANGPAARELLEFLGYREQLAYERFRTVFRRPRQAGELAWDVTPFGVYLEIEGTAAFVRRTARALGLDPAAAEPRSYAALYTAWRRGHPAR